MTSVLHFLNKDRINNHLQNLFTTLDEPKTKWKQLRTFADKDQVEMATRVCMTGVPAAYRLCYQNEDSNAPMEEVVLAMQGILIDESLPPIEQKKKVPRNPYFAQQMVVLSGYGTPGFEQCEHAITLIDEKLQMSLKDGRYLPYQPTTVGGHDYGCIEASNPYFTIRNLNTRAIPLQFSPGVDPKGFLLDAGGQTLVHLDDNVVEYFAKQETIIGNEKIERFNSVKPDEFRFRAGLLVEIQMSFLIRKVNGGFKMFKVLRSIAMLSDRHLLNANALYQASLNSAKQPRAQSLKRRLAYDEEEEGEVVETRQSMARMVISDMFAKTKN